MECFYEQLDLTLPEISWKFIPNVFSNSATNPLKWQKRVFVTDMRMWDLASANSSRNPSVRAVTAYFVAE